MILAELYDKSDGSFLCLIQCRSMHEFEYLTSIMAFNVDIEVDVINYCDETTLQ